MKKQIVGFSTIPHPHEMKYDDLMVPPPLHGKALDHSLPTPGAFNPNDHVRYSDLNRVKEGEKFSNCSKNTKLVFNVYEEAGLLDNRLLSNDKDRRKIHNLITSILEWHTGVGYTNLGEKEKGYLIDCQYIYLYAPDNCNYWAANLLRLNPKHKESISKLNLEHWDLNFAHEGYDRLPSIIEDAASSTILWAMDMGFGMDIINGSTYPIDRYKEDIVEEDKGENVNSNYPSFSPMISPKTYDIGVKIAFLIYKCKFTGSRIVSFDYIYNEIKSRALNHNYIQKEENSRSIYEDHITTIQKLLIMSILITPSDENVDIHPLDILFRSYKDLMENNILFSNIDKLGNYDLFLLKRLGYNYSNVIKYKNIINAHGENDKFIDKINSLINGNMNFNGKDLIHEIQKECEIVETEMTVSKAIHGELKRTSIPEQYHKEIIEMVIKYRELIIVG